MTIVGGLFEDEPELTLALETLQDHGFDTFTVLGPEELFKEQVVDEDTEERLESPQHTAPAPLAVSRLIRVLTILTTPAPRVSKMTWRTLAYRKQNATFTSPACSKTRQRCWYRRGPIALTRPERYCNRKEPPCPHET